VIGVDEMAEVKWIKIVTDIFDDEKILMIENLPDRDSIIVIWFKLLCMAGKQNNSGVFLFNDRIPYTDEMLATIFRRPLNTVRLALKTFEEYGMIEIINNTITIPKWEKHQSLDALENSRKQTRDRVAKYREKQKEIACNGGSNVTCNVTDDVTVTLCNADRIRIDKERDKNKSIIYADSESALVSEFEQIWKTYPRKEGKTNALKAYIKARTDKKDPVSMEDVQNGLQAYIEYIKAEGVPMQYIKHGSTWFNQRCWNDEYTSSKATQEEYNTPTAADYDFSDWYK
jgi:predicted phage replisome organizer